MLISSCSDVVLVLYLNILLGSISSFACLDIHHNFQLSPASLYSKTACRKVGLKKWPYRTFIARAPLPSRLLHDQKVNHEQSASSPPHESSVCASTRALAEDLFDSLLYTRKFGRPLFLCIVSAPSFILFSHSSRVLSQVSCELNDLFKSNSSLSCHCLPSKP